MDKTIFDIDWKRFKIAMGIYIAVIAAAIILG